jgi:hypothetical protein
MAMLRKMKRKKQSDMNKLISFPGFIFLCLLLSASTSCSSDSGRQSNTKNDSYPPLLSGDSLRKRMESMSEIQVRECLVSDLHLKGLVTVLNKTLQKAGRSERVVFDERQNVDIDVEESLKGNFFSPLFQSQGSLDKKHLVEQINSGSVCDLLMNLQGLCFITVGWFPYGFEINKGDIEPSKLGFKNWYQLRTK